MNKLYMTVCWLLLSFLVHETAAQGWQRVFPDSVNHRGYSAVETADGGFIITGWNTATNGTSVIRVNSQGEPQWRRQLLTGEFTNYRPQIFDIGDGLFAVMAADGEIGGAAQLGVIDRFGNIPNILFLPDASDDLLFVENQDMVVAGNFGDFGGERLRARRMNWQGDIQWEYEQPSGTFNFVGSMAETPDGGYIIGGHNSTTANAYLLKLNAQGQEVWSQDYRVSDLPHLNTQALSNSDGTILWIGNLRTIARVFKTDADGELLWSKEFFLDSLTHFNDAVLTADGNIALAGQYGNPQQTHALLMLLDQDGEEIWRRGYGLFDQAGAWGITPASDGGFLLTGSTEFAGSEYLYLIRTDAQGYSTYAGSGVNGQLRFDEDGDCLPDNSETPLKQWLVEVSGDATHHTVTREDGRFFSFLPPGNYQAHPVPPNEYWATCPPLSFTIANPEDSVSLNLHGQAAVICPRLEVSLASAFMRPCRSTTYHIQLCNTGTQAADTPYLELELDEKLSYESSTLPVINQNGQELVFFPGPLGIQECLSFQVTAFLDCGARPSQIICSEAHAFPDDQCVADPEWSGASIEVSGECFGDSLYFNIRNTGTAPMAQPRDFIVVEDDVILLEGQFNLPPGGALPVQFAAAGATYFLQAEQEPGHPGQSRPSVTIESCGGPGGPGFFNNYPQNDGDAFIDIECQEVRASYDPNDKRAFPEGAWPEHFIEPGQEIEYQIRFQNTGNDTAFQVVLLDTLSEWLDITSIQLGAASHPYAFDILPGRVLRFTFDDILLPDSTTNEPASQGFVWFRIGQNAPLGVRIENRAAIYFDVNPPVITNTTFHTIDRNFFPRISDPPIPDPPLEISISPNPVASRTYIRIFNAPAAPVWFVLYDARGRLVRRERHAQPRFEFFRSRLPAGLYLYQIVIEGKIASAGKLVIQ